MALDFQLPGCDFIEPPCFVNRYGELGSTDDESQRGVVATNLLAMRRMHVLLVLPNNNAEPYASVVRLLDETAHRAGVSETRRASHPCPVALDPYDAAPRWLTLSLRVLVSQLMLQLHMATTGVIPKSEMWVLEHLTVFPLTPAPPVFRMPFEVSDLSNIVGHFYQPRPRSQWLHLGHHHQYVSRPRVELTQTESNWFYARLSAFAFYAYCTMLPPYAVWGALRLFFDRVETIVAQDRGIEIEAYKIRSANPVLFDAWNRWNEQMALYAHWFVALYQVMERSSTSNLVPVRALINGVVAETIQEPFRELRSFMRDARDYWPAMYSCQSELSLLEPLLVPVQRVSRHEAAALLQTRLCRRDTTAFLNVNLPDEDPNCGSVCYRLPDMLPSHMRATLEHIGFEPDDIGAVVMAPYFNGTGGGHTYDLFVRMHARHECAWQIASICDLPRAARPLLQRLGRVPRECIVNRPSVVRVLQRAVLRLVNTEEGSLRLRMDAVAVDEFTFLRLACGATIDPTAALVFFCEAGLQSTRTGNDVLRLSTPVGASDADLTRSVKQWSSALGATTSPSELLGTMTRDRFREIVRATAPLLDRVQHLRVFVMFACANPLLGDIALCADLQALGAVATWPHAIVTQEAPEFRLAESALGVVFDTQSATQLQTLMRVVETLNALRANVCAMAEPYTAVQQNIGWHQTDDDLRLLREREAHARTSGLRARAPPAVVRSLALYPDQCGLVCASMRNCANGDDLVAELLLGPDAKMNWQPTSSDPDYYRIAQPPAAKASATRPVASSDATADARTRAHFGDGCDNMPRMRPSYPEPARSTVHISATDVNLANRARTLGHSVRVDRPPVSVVVSTPPPPAAAASAAKRARPAPQAQPPKAVVQFNSAGKVLRTPKPPAVSRTPKPTDKLKCTASMLDFMELDKS